MQQPTQEQLAKELVEQALERFVGTVPAKELEAIRLLLEMELLTTKAGAETLRSVSPDPHVDQSGAVAKEPKKSQKAPKSRRAGGKR